MEKSTVKFISENKNRDASLHWLANTLVTTSRFSDLKYNEIVVPLREIWKAFPQDNTVLQLYMCLNAHANKSMIDEATTIGRILVYIQLSADIQMSISSISRIIEADSSPTAMIVQELKRIAERGQRNGTTGVGISLLRFVIDQEDLGEDAMALFETIVDAFKFDKEEFIFAEKKKKAMMKEMTLMSIAVEVQNRIRSNCSPFTVRLFPYECINVMNIVASLRYLMLKANVDESVSNLTTLRAFPQNNITQYRQFGSTRSNMSFTMRSTLSQIQRELMFSVPDDSTGDSFSTQAAFYNDALEVGLKASKEEFFQILHEVLRVTEILVDTTSSGLQNRWHLHLNPYLQSSRRLSTRLNQREIQQVAWEFYQQEPHEWKVEDLAEQVDVDLKHLLLGREADGVEGRHGDAVLSKSG